MRWYANELGHGGEADFWALVGLLHDVDFEQWPEQHCKKRPSCWLRLARTMRSYTRFAATATACAAMWSPCWKWKSVICRGRADGPCRRGRADAPLEERAGYGAFQPEEKFKDKNSPRAAPATSSARARNALAGSWTGFWTARCRPCGPARMILRHRWPLCKPFLRDIRSRPTNQMKPSKAPREFSRRGACLFSAGSVSPRVCRPASAERCCP